MQKVIKLVDVKKIFGHKLYILTYIKLWIAGNMLFKETNRVKFTTSSHYNICSSNKTKTTKFWACTNISAQVFWP